VEAIIIKKKVKKEKFKYSLTCSILSLGWACGCDCVPLATVKDQTIIDAKYSGISTIIIAI
jgi:hypothetical protein